MSYITLEQANAIIAGVLSKGQELGFKPLSVAVVDAGGHLLAFQRSNGASSLRPAVAIAKAAGGLSLGVSSRKVAEMAAERPSFVVSLASLTPHGLVPAAGGIVVVDEDDRPIGAVGTTGDTSDNDEVCTVAGIAAAGLRGQA